MGLLLAFASILAVDAGLYGQDILIALPAYIALTLEAISSTIIDRASDSVSPTFGNAPLAMLSALGAWALSFAVNTVFPVVRSACVQPT